jgi:site-specific DNA recombinase
MDVLATMTGKDYLRVSVDKSGRERSPEEQHRDNLKSGDKHGFRIVGSYREKVGSASKFKVKERAQFDRLMRDLRAGDFGADVLVLWAGSRGSRMVKEWVNLIDACASAGVLIHITSGKGRMYDPADDEDFYDLINIANASQKYSAELSGAVKRALDDNAEAGKPHGRIRFGYRRIYEGKRFVSEVIDESEAPTVVEMFRRVKAGESLRSIEMNFAARGITTRNGKRFTAGQLRSVLTNEAYAGVRIYDPNRRNTNGRPAGVVKRFAASWPAIISPEEFYAVKALLDAPERRTSRPGRGIHLLSMMGPVCGACGGPLSVTYRRKRPEYRCHWKSCVRVSKSDLDGYVEAYLERCLSRPDRYEAIIAREETGNTELSNVRDELAAKRVRHQELDAKITDALAEPDGDVTAADLGKARAKVATRIAELEQRERDLATPSALSGLVGPGMDFRARWDASPMSAKREVVRLLLTPEYIGELRLMQTEIRGSHATPVEDRVMWRRQRDYSQFPWWEEVAD